LFDSATASIGPRAAAARPTGDKERKLSHTS
jgi:hypothetical protein